MPTRETTTNDEVLADGSVKRTIENITIFSAVEFKLIQKNEKTQADQAKVQSDASTATLAQSQANVSKIKP